MPQHPRKNGDRPTGLVRRAVAEALGAVAAPRVVEAVVAAALRACRRTEVPERGRDVAEFIHGPLFEAAQGALGDDAAMAVVEELAQLARLVDDDEISSVRTTNRPTPVVPAVVRVPMPVRDTSDAEDPWAELRDELTRDELAIADDEGGVDVAIDVDDGPAPNPLLPTSPAPRNELPLVLVASSDPSSVSRLSLALCGVAAIEPVRDALSLLESLGRSAASVVVLDSRHPTVQAETLLAMDPELPEGSQVVMWGERPDTRARLSGLGDGVPAHWTLCGPDASAEHVASLCRVLLG